MTGTQDTCSDLMITEQGKVISEAFLQPVMVCNIQNYIYAQEKVFVFLLLSHLKVSFIDRIYYKWKI